jgi:hypothetical protein
VVNDEAYQFYLTHDLSQYAGKWVALLDGEVLASGDTATQVLASANQKAPGRTPALAKVPTGEVLVLCRL